MDEASTFSRYKHSDFSHCFWFCYILGMWNQHAWEGFYLASTFVQLQNHLQQISEQTLLLEFWSLFFQDPVKKDQHLCCMLTKPLSSGSLECFRPISCVSFTELLCSLFPFDVPLLTLEKLTSALTVYLILKLLPFLVYTDRTNTIYWVWMSFSFLVFWLTLYFSYIFL